VIRISIDDSVTDSSFENLDCVGDVINAVASDLPPNRIVTSVFVDGQMVPRQQSSPALKGRLEAIRELQIRTADAQVWATNGLDRAVSDVERLQKSLSLTAEFFRDGKQLEGSRIFLHCVEGLERFLDTIVLTRLAMKLDFTRLQVEGITLARLEKDFSAILTGIVECQERRDFDGLADKVEYELLPNFASWTRALTQLRISFHSNA
jgi:hypothetical protein